MLYDKARVLYDKTWYSYDKSEFLYHKTGAPHDKCVDWRAAYDALFLLYDKVPGLYDEA
jgi:hypothetical protein